MKFQAKALVACCECGSRQELVNLVARCGLTPVVTASTSAAVLMLGSESVCIAFCQDDLPGDGFRSVLKKAQQVAVPVVISSRLDDTQRYLESMQLGAFDFICQPYYYPEVAALASAVPHRFPLQSATTSAVNVNVA